MLTTARCSSHFTLKNLKAVLTIGALCAGSAVFSGCGDTISDRDIEFASLAEVRAWSQDKPGTARLIDPRSPQEYAAGHLPGAQSLQLPSVPERKDSLDPALARYKVLVVYGNDPGSGIARAMTKRLMRAGASDVKLFSGGIVEWTRAGLPIEKAPVPAPAAQPTSK
jgi:rhodanese-related sulfurtransferase